MSFTYLSILSIRLYFLHENYLLNWTCVSCFSVRFFIFWVMSTEQLYGKCCLCQIEDLDALFWINFLNDAFIKALSSCIDILCFLCSCGSCGYDLNLNSSSRNTSTIGSKYGKSIKKGIISFFSVDESRFNQVEEFSCVPYFMSKNSWGFFRRRTKLLCRKCGNLIGIASDLNNASSIHLITDGSDSPSASSSEFSGKRKYDIRIRSLQPSSAAFGTPLVS